MLDQVEVDTEAFKVEWWRPAFTRRREIFMARTAMAGFLSLQIGEASFCISCFFGADISVEEADLCAECFWEFNLGYLDKCAVKCRFLQARGVLGSSAT